MEKSQKIIRVKNLVVWTLVLLAVLFMVLSLIPKARQKCIFPYGDLCDYREFILPTIRSALPYEPDMIHARDACYPPIAYCAVSALSVDRGEKWSLTRSEIHLLTSIFIMQLLGALLLVWKIPDVKLRTAVGLVILMTPACICSVLRGNPSGWAFAFVCMFLRWYNSNSTTKRIAAAVALGVATSLKLTPCLFGILYLTDVVLSPRRMPWREIIISALTASILIFLPFVFLGGVESVPQWISNARANAAFYSVESPLWGFAAFANRIVDSPEITLPSIGRFALGTNVFAVVLLVATVFVRTCYKKLLYIGAAMAFMTHHDYGGAYLIPAFVAWLLDVCSAKSNICLLLEAVAWVLILTPLQIPNPFHSGTLNAMLQNEFLFVLLFISFLPSPNRLGDEHDLQDLELLRFHTHPVKS